MPAQMSVPSMPQTSPSSHSVSQSVNMLLLLGCQIPTSEKRNKNAEGIKLLFHGVVVVCAAGIMVLCDAADGESCPLIRFVVRNPIHPSQEYHLPPFTRPPFWAWRRRSGVCGMGNGDKVG